MSIVFIMCRLLLKLAVSFPMVYISTVFFHHRNIGIFSLTEYRNIDILQRKKAVPPKEIDITIERRAMFEKNPLKHTYRE